MYANLLIKLKGTFFDTAEILHACADRDEMGSQLKIETPSRNQFSYRRPSGRLQAIRPAAGCKPPAVDKAAMRRLAFWGNVTLSTSTHRHYDESVHRIKQLSRGHFFWTHPTPGGFRGYLLLKIFRDGPRPNLARMCG